MRRFKYCALKDKKPGDSVKLDRDEESHLFRTLRAEPDDEIILLDGQGRVANGRVAAGKTIQITEIEEMPGPVRKIHLYIAPPRKQKMDLLLKQAVELGVWKIVPVISERSIVQPEKGSVSERWSDLLFEACKQSGNPYLPVLSEPLSFRNAVADASDVCSVNYYGSPRKSSRENVNVEAVGFFVGPEGGFTEDEEHIMEEKGFLPLRIGNWTLRVETAAVAGIALLSNM